MLVSYETEHAGWYTYYDLTLPLGEEAVCQEITQKNVCVCVFTDPCNSHTTF